jgi:lysophospholipase L1-like esterase
MRKAIARVLCCGAVFACSAAPGGVFYPDGATTLHFAFEGSPNGDRPIVRPPAFFHADDGFGFVDSPELVGTSRGVTAPRYFRFDANLPEGNYDVSVTLGGTRSESITTVKAEGHRPMLLDVRVGPGQTATRTFTVNVRHGGAGEKGGSLDLDGRLNLEFAGTDPSLMKLDIKPNETAVTVYLAGGSTVCDQEEIPFAGWGQMLPILFKPGKVAVSNQAVGGGTAGSFLAEKRLEGIAKRLRAGDYLVVEFGASEVNGRGTDAAAWQGYLQAYVEEALRHKATPILITAPPRREFDDQGKIRRGAGDFSEWTRAFAQQHKVALIDLHADAAAFLEKLGPDGSRRAFVHYAAGTFPGQAGALADDGRFSPYGAMEMAKLVAQGLKRQGVELAGHLAAEPESMLDAGQFPGNLGYDYLLKGK